MLVAACAPISSRVSGWCRLASIQVSVSCERIQDLLTSRLQKFGRREHLTVNWQDGCG
jgi:hypothetical protein